MVARLDRFAGFAGTLALLFAVSACPRDRQEPNPAEPILPALAPTPEKRLPEPPEPPADVADPEGDPEDITGGERPDVPDEDDRCQRSRVRKDEPAVRRQEEAS